MFSCDVLICALNNLFIIVKVRKKQRSIKGKAAYWSAVTAAVAFFWYGSIYRNNRLCAAGWARRHAIPRRGLHPALPWAEGSVCPDAAFNGTDGVSRLGDTTPERSG